MVTAGHRLEALALILSVVACLRPVAALPLRADGVTLPATGGLGNRLYLAIITVVPVYGRSGCTGQYRSMVLVMIVGPVGLLIVVFCLTTILKESRGPWAPTTSMVRYVKHASFLSGTSKPINACNPPRCLHS